MDCSVTEDDWFELRAYVTNPDGSGAWERDVTQAAECNGGIGGYRPYASPNHLARCGFINSFVFERGSCSVDTF